METKTPWHARTAGILALLLPVFFIVAALGTKFGLWGWEFGLGILTIRGGMVLIPLVLLLSIVSLVLVLRKTPKTGWKLATIGLVISGALLLFGMNAARTGSANPIHDVATDTANPPQFSDEVIAAREAGESNPLKDYAAPIEKGGTHGAVVADLYPDLGPIDLGDKNPDTAAALVTLEMVEFGLNDVTARLGPDGAVIIEGVADTFWYGFKDDVVLRIADGKVDFRSVSRVGQSDLGANAARIEKLKAAVEKRLAE